MNKLNIQRLKRQKRVRSKIFGTKTRPRLTVHRSAKHIYAQLIDDEKGQTILAVSDTKIAKGKKTEKLTKTQKAEVVGKLLADNAKAKKIKKIVFDRGSYKFHGRVKTLSEGAKEGGLEF